MLKKVLTLIRKNEKILKQASKQTIVLSFTKTKGGMLTFKQTSFIYNFRKEVI